MTICVQFERSSNRLRFEKFPTASLKYQKNLPRDNSPSINLQVTDTRTQKTSSVFLKSIDLQNIGISLTAWKSRSDTPERLSNLIRNTHVINSWLTQAPPVVYLHLAPQFLSFFNNIPYATRMVSSAMHQNIQHLLGKKQKLPGTPGMYFDFSTSPPQIFINLKKTPLLGKGSLGKVREVLWLNPPNANPTIVAKKVLQPELLKHSDHFRRELDALREFSGKRGIISLIAGGTYDGKFAIFLPFYDCTLYQWLCLRPFQLSVNQKLNVISQWLEGLATISKKGIHGDLSLPNLYLRQEKGAVEAVIADFGAYRPHGKQRHGMTTLLAAPPEYHAKEVVMPTHDVWAMGLALHELFSVQRLELWKFAGEDKIEQMKQWFFELRPDWILQRRTHSDTPPFILELINRMLDPDPEQRCTAQQAFEDFSKGYSSLTDKSSTEDLSAKEGKSSAAPAKKRRKLPTKPIEGTEAGKGVINNIPHSVNPTGDNPRGVPDH